MMHLVERFQYHPLQRITQSNGIRHYVCPISGKMLPSITTILDGTSVKPYLIEWRKRLGDVKADQVKREAVGLGTLMHSHLECHVLGKPRPGGNNFIRRLGEQMADQIILHGLRHVEEVWGSEVMLYVPQLFAGTTDLVGIYKGNPAIMDFKTAKKMRSRAMIEDYLLQLCAYIICHNEMHGTTISTGVIFMVDRDFNYQEFLIDGAAFRDKTEQWFERVEQYFAKTEI
jgi:CRISPR/Cas system-associated exonuclease Cas4 (RecB family)